MTAPDIRKVVASCSRCHHWQIDVRPGAVSDLGGAQEAFMAIAYAHLDHLPECPAGDEGRIRVNGVWVDPPKMSDGAPATAALEMQHVPPWWVVR